MEHETHTTDSNMVPILDETSYMQSIESAHVNGDGGGGGGRHQCST